MQSVGGENDGGSRQLGRFVQEVAPFELTGMNIRLIWRRDRYLRGTDSLSFQGHGYPAARITEPRENFNHEHQNTRVVNGVQLGDLIQYVDFDYVARVAWRVFDNSVVPPVLPVAARRSPNCRARTMILICDDQEKHGPAHAQPTGCATGWGYPSDLTTRNGPS
jgi:hypothetical protein